MARSLIPCILNVPIVRTNARCQSDLPDVCADCEMLDLAVCIPFLIKLTEVNTIES